MCVFGGQIIQACSCNNNNNTFAAAFARVWCSTMVRSLMCDTLEPRGNWANLTWRREIRSKLDATRSLSFTGTSLGTRDANFKMLKFCFHKRWKFAQPPCAHSSTSVYCREGQNRYCSTDEQNRLRVALYSVRHRYNKSPACTFTTFVAPCNIFTSRLVPKSSQFGFSNRPSTTDLRCAVKWSWNNNNNNKNRPQKNII